MPTGVHRHPIAFVAYDEGVYAIKELPVHLAMHEFETLRTLEDRTTRTARPAGLVERAWLEPDDGSAGAVITRYVEYAFPYRELVMGGSFGIRRNQMLDAFAGLLVELHVAGCFRGDCSLSNVLYRYDAGAIDTIMVDAETSQLYESISDGRRREDLEIMKENLAGGMSDIAAAADRDLDHADLDIGSDVADRYGSLWDELNSDLVIAPDQRYLIRQRIDRLNELGFAVNDIDLVPDGDGNRVRIRVQVGGRNFHADRLRRMAGIDASENQARHILADFARHEARRGGYDSPADQAVGVMAWRASRFAVFTGRITELRPEFDPVQGYADFLNYRHGRSTAAGHDLDSETTFAEWLEAGMPGFEPVP